MYKDAQEIITRIATDYGISVKRLLGTDRKRHIIEARNKAMRMIRIECGLSLSEIGEIFKRDPSSVSRILRNG